MSSYMLLRIVSVLLFILPGLLSLMAGGIIGSRWFIESRNARLFRSRLGEKGVRIYYAVLGLLLITAGVLLMTDPLDVLSQAK